MLAVTTTGSHCPFLDSSSSSSSDDDDDSLVVPSFLSWLIPAMIKDPLTGKWMLDSWADRVAVDYYTAALDVYEERR